MPECPTGPVSPCPLVLPRFGTQRDLSRPTYGHEVAEVARRLGKPLMPWQQYVADVATEFDPVTGELVYEEVIVTVPRQSGKTTLILALLVWRCIVMARRLGPQTCTYLAQSGKMARRKLEREFARLMRRSPHLREVTGHPRPSRDNEWRLSMNNNGEHILFGTQSYLQIDAPTEDASHGDVLDMPVMDEAFAHGDDLVEQAVDAATVTRRSPQSYVVSTAGNERSRFLARKVLAGRRAVDEPGSRTAYFEWSVPDSEAWDDPDVWARFLPALGHTITVERLLARLDKALRNPDEVDEDGFEPGVAGFRRGYLNQWPSFPSFDALSSVPSVVDADVWESLVSPVGQIVSAVVLGVGVSHDGASGAIVVAGRDADGVPQLELVQRESRTWWIEKALRDWREQQSPLAVGWDHSGPGRLIAPDIKRACSGMQMIGIGGREWSAACEAFAHAVEDRRVRHLGDELLSVSVVGGVSREMPSGWLWDLSRSSGDPAVLVAATAALRTLEMVAEPVVDDEPAPFFVY